MTEKDYLKMIAEGDKEAFRVFFACKTLGLDLDPMEAKSRYGMRDEQEKTFTLQKGLLGEDRLRVCTESSKHGRMFICFVALILASYIRHIRDTKPELTKPSRQWRPFSRRCRPSAASSTAAAASSSLRS